MPSSAVQTCARSEEHTSELQSHDNLVCRLLLEKQEKRGASPHVHQCSAAPCPAPYPSPCAVWIRVGGALDPAMRSMCGLMHPSFFFFNDTATTEIYTLSLHDALPI